MRRKKVNRIFLTGNLKVYTYKRERNMWKYTIIWIYKSRSMWIYMNVSMWICGRKWVCKNAIDYVCEWVKILCDCANVTYQYNRWLWERLYVYVIVEVSDLYIITSHITCHILRIVTYQTNIWNLTQLLNKTKQTKKIK